MKRKLFLMIAVLLIGVFLPINCFAEDSYSIEVSQTEYESKYKNDSHYAVTGTVTYYRYQTRTKETKTSGYNTLSGYTLYDTKTSSSTSGYVMGKPISTSTSYTDTSKVTKSAVNTGYYYYAYTVANPNKTSDWTYYADTSRANCINHMKNAGFSSTAYGEARLRYFWYISSSDLGSMSGKLNKNIPYCADSTVSKGTTAKTGDHLYDLKLYKYNQCYKVKTDTVTNYFYKYSNWSAWSDWTTEYRSGSSEVQNTETKINYILLYTPDTHEHQWNSYYTVDVSPTCTSEGSESIHCSECGTIKNGSERSTEKLSHSWSSYYIVDKEATCEDAGAESKHCTVCGTINESSIRTINAKGHQWSDPWVITEATLDTEGLSGKICSACGTVKNTAIPKLSDFDISYSEVSEINTKTYTGKSIKPSPEVWCNNTKLTKGKDYTLSYSGNKYPGRAKVVIKGKGKFKGQASTYFTIELKNVYLTSIKGQKKGFTAKWKKASKTEKKRISGYQIRYSNDPGFKSGVKTKSTSNKKVKQVKISKQKSKKLYYVQIRTYLKVKGKKYYSAWSPIESVKTK